MKLESMRAHQLLRHPIAPLCVFTLATSAGFAAYVASGAIPSPALEILIGVVWAPLAVYWIRADARRRNLSTPCFDFGMLCYLFFPLSAAWYCFWSRGLWRGLALVGLLYLLLAAPWIVAIVVEKAVYGAL
jgi:hypothetical protein